MEIKSLVSTDEWWQSVAEYANTCSWQPTGAYMANRMKNNEFFDWERVFVALEDAMIAGFCAFSKTSRVFGDTYSPYVGFIYVGEPFRGKRISEKLCAFVFNYAKTVGFDKVYLYSDLVNFYEKYGFIKIDEKDAPWGAKQSIYMRHV